MNGAYRLAIQARDLGQLAERRTGAVRDADHVVADLRFLRRSFGAETDDGESSPDFTGVAAAVLVDGCNSSGHLAVGVAHGSSRRV